MPPSAPDDPALGTASLDAAGGWRGVECPHCGEAVELHLDPESVGTWVEDCPVCCRPWQVTVTRDRDLVPSIRVDPA